MARIAYFRVSTRDQSIEAQRSALGGPFDHEFKDEGVSGATLAKDRPGFAAMLAYARSGDTLYVYALDRLGRDALDVQATVRALMAKDVSIDIRGLGVISKGVGELIVAVLAHIAQMERDRIIERTEHGRAAARAQIAADGKTRKGATSLGRPHAHAPEAIREWRKANSASIAQTAAHFGIGATTVKRAMAGA